MTNIFTDQARRQVVPAALSSRMIFYRSHAPRGNEVFDAPRRK